MLAGMFTVSEAEAAAIRAVYEQRGELSAAVELRRRFPGILDNVLARECARIIASWKPLPLRCRGHGRAARLHPAAIKPLAQFPAGLEERPCLLVHWHWLTGARIAPDASIAPLYREGAETAQLDAIAANQRVGDPIEYRRHDQLDIGLQQMRIAGGEFRDEL